MSDGKTPEDEPGKEDTAASEEAVESENIPTPTAEGSSANKQAADAQDEPSTENSSEQQPAQAPSESSQPAGKRSLLLPVAILLAVVMIVAFFLWQQGDNDDVAPEQTPTQTQPQTTAPTEDLIPAATVADIDALRGEIEALNNNVGALSTALDEANEALERQARDNSRLKDSIDERVDLLDSLPGRVENTEDALVTLQGISAGSRNAWLLAEAEYYMQIANAQVQLANNPELAATALELADQRIRELGDPAYTPVRRAMASEIAALKAVSGTDIEGVTLTLGSLASMVPTLPLINEIDVPEAERSDAALDELSGWQRMKASVNSALSGLVRIRQSDERVKAMLSPEAEYFLRLNLQLQLQAARLSLLLSETAGFQQSLQDAAGWIREYFDRNDPAVRNALEMIDDIGATQIVVERPDVSESLRLLRQQRTVEAIAE